MTKKDASFLLKNCFMLSMLLIKRFEKIKAHNKACHLFLIFCEECHKKRARKLKKSLVVKPLIQTDVMSRAHHFQSTKVETSGRMALKLLEIFLTFGAPNILQSDNGRKFLYAIIAELKECWAELNFVTGGAKVRNLEQKEKTYEKNENNIPKYSPEDFIKARKEADARQTRAVAKTTRPF
ncbi:SCAN domain-containing protein 3 [Trichinella pseudospiralis]|uniref:SCAN domain-containing protein 3 n=1 Tax=Trichinella pseudospiralis TaxID=6337 RepID=A0A0V1JW23_TRIPS|nr:SCAN domain-containing protein 3 [Trichinella pseudospiralis]